MAPVPRAVQPVRAAMHPVCQYTLSLVGAAVVGVLSAAVVLAIGWLLDRRTGVRLETTFGAAALVGLALMFAGGRRGDRALVAVSVLLCGWVVLPVLLTPPILLWRVVAWCRRRVLADRPPHV